MIAYWRTSSGVGLRFILSCSVTLKNAVIEAGRGLDKLNRRIDKAGPALVWINLKIGIHIAEVFNIGSDFAEFFEKLFGIGTPDGAIFKSYCTDICY